MNKAKVKYIPNHDVMNCWTCAPEGSKGYIIKDGDKKECKTCGGTGKFVEKSYYLIYTDKNGQKHGFMVDSIK